MRTHFAIKLVPAVAVPKAVTVSCVGRNNTRGCVSVPGLSCGTTTWFPFDSGDASIHPSVHGLFGLDASLLSGGQPSFAYNPNQGPPLFSLLFCFLVLLLYRVLSGWLLKKKSKGGKNKKKSKMGLVLQFSATSLWRLMPTGVA
jgi:hypothetical protein